VKSNREYRGVVTGAGILVVDDDAALRQLVRVTLDSGGFSPVTEAETGDEALAIIRRTRSFLSILDVRLPGVSGYELCRQIRELHGSEPVVIFLSGARTEPFDRVAGLDAGGDDFLLKPFAPEELLGRVRAVLRRTHFVPGTTAATLTPREHEILRLLAAGRPQEEIARELFVASNTVGKHIEHLLKKLNVHSRAEAVAYAYREHIVTRMA
jgi:two-component system, OmpR family, response regulator